MKVYLRKPSLLPLCILTLFTLLAGLSAKAATLVWDPNPVEEGVTHYIVTIESILGRSDNTVTSGTSFPLVGLQPGVNYTLSVSAISPTGASAPSVIPFALPVPPSITAQPQSRTLNAGESFSLSVTATGTGPLSYRWFRDGSELSGQTSATLTVQSATAQDEGSYIVRVSNDHGTDESDPAIVTVETTTVQPPNIGVHPVSQTVALNSAFTLSVTAAGAGPLSYQWFRGVTELSGQNSASLTVSQASLQNEGSYTVVVSNEGGSATSNPAEINVIAPPRILWHPESDSVSIGSSFQVSVAAESEVTPQYQWLKDGVEIPGATASVYQVASAEPQHTGNYRARVSNLAGAVLSDPAVITIPGAPRIIRDLSPITVNEGAELRLNVEVSGTSPFGFEWFRNDVSIGTTSSAEFVIASTSPSDAGMYSVRVTGPLGTANGIPAQIAIFAKPVITGHPQNAFVAIGGRATLTVGASGSGLTYQWLKDGQVLANAISSTLTIASVQQSNFGSYVARVSNVAGTVESTPATIALLEAPSIQTQPAGLSVLVDNAFTLSVTATGTGPLSYQWYRNGQLLQGETGSTVQRSAATGSDAGNYHVIVSNAGGTFRSSTAIVNVVPHITVTRQPIAVNVVVGAPLNLSVEASSTLALSYQWFRNNELLPGKTGAALQIPAAGVADSGDYHVSIRNSLEEISSAVAKVVVGVDQSGGVLQISTTGSGTGEGLSITATGLPNTTYEIQVATDLQNPNWTTLRTVVSDGNGSFLIQPPTTQGNFWFIRTARQ